MIDMKRVKIELIRKDMTNIELAEKLNVNVNTISRWLNGNNINNIEKFIEMLNVLNLEIKDIIKK